jgi:hypothetical protein
LSSFIAKITKGWFLVDAVDLDSERSASPRFSKESTRQEPQINRGAHQVLP